MPTLRDVVVEVSQYLVDQEPDFEFTHWEESDILTYLQDALRILSINLKYLFVSDKVIDLKPGSYQQAAAGCSDIRAVLGSVDKYGTPTSGARRTSLRAAQTINRPICQPAGGEHEYRVTNFQLDPGNPKTFFVQPPVPARGKHRALVSCFSVPRLTSLGQELPVGDQYIPILKEFMLYYAYGRDTESVPARDYQKIHWDRGAQLLAAAKGTQLAVLTVAQNPVEVPV